MNLMRRLSQLSISGVIYLLAAMTVNLTCTQYAMAATCWYTLTDMPTARRAPAAVELNGYIYVIGGRDENVGAGERYNVVERYNPATETWATMTPMPTARAWPVSAAVNGKIYTIGGSNNFGKLGTVEEYDPVSDSWTTKTSMADARARDDAVVGVVNNKIYVISGHRSVAVAWVDEYDPVADTWTTKTDMPVPRALASSAVINDKIYVFGGWSVDTIFATVYEYDPAFGPGGTWTSMNSMPTERSRTAAGVVGGQIYVIGGFNYSDGRLNVVESYDPGPPEQWTTESSIPTWRSDIAATAAGGMIYVFGGMNSDVGPVLDVVEGVDFSCTNNPPGVPYNPIPGGGWSNVDPGTFLSWTGSDSDPGDTLTYDVYFGESLTTPLLVSSNQSNIFYDPPGLLNPYTWYKWRILARDNQGAVASARWQFKSGGHGNQIQNGSFETGLSSWNLETFQDAAATLTSGSAAPGEGSVSAKINITNIGTGTPPVLDDVRFTQADLDMTAGITYNLIFWARASVARDIDVVLKWSLPPYTEYHRSTRAITTGWVMHTIDIPGDNLANMILQFSLGETVSEVWLDGIKLVNNPSIKVEKTASPTSLVEPGGNVDFTVVVTNTGTVDVTLNALDDDGVDLDGQGNCTIPQTIAVGADYQCLFTTAVSGNAGDKVTDVVTATASDGASNTVQASDTATVTITGNTVLSIDVSKTAYPISVPEGGDVTFTVMVTNTGTENVTLDTMVDNIHGNLAGQGDCTVGQTVSAGASYQCSFTATVTGSAGEIEIDTVTATVSDDENIEVTDSDTASVTITVPTLSISVGKTASPTRVVQPGGNVTFTVIINNTGSLDVTLDTLVDNIHGNLAGLGGCTVGQAVSAGASYQCSFSATISGNVGDIETDIVTATVSDFATPPNFFQATDSATVTIIDVSSIDVSFLPSIYLLLLH